jgi:hypothetical protein
VNPLTTIVRLLGNDGAVANAQAVLEERAREDWIVQGLTLRLEQKAASVVVAAGPVGARAVA